MSCHLPCNRRNKAFARSLRNKNHKRMKQAVLVSPQRISNMK